MLAVGVGVGAGAGSWLGSLSLGVVTGVSDTLVGVGAGDDGALVGVGAGELVGEPTGQVGTSVAV